MKTHDTTFSTRAMSVTMHEEVHRQATVNISKQLTGPMTDLALRCIMRERFKWQEEFLETLAKALKNATGFAVADLFPSSSLLRAVGSTVREMQDMFPGGSESTSTTLEWAMTELVRNPNVMHKAEAEIREALQGKARVTDDDLLNLKYPKYIIRETLRLHPIAPFLVPKECQESCKILGYDIPKGTVVFVNAWAINRDPRYWDNAEMFMPERFEEKMFDFRGTNFEFIPFGAGRRMFPGTMFAHVTIELALTALLYHFDWQLPPSVTPDMMDIEQEFGMTVSRKKHLYLRPILRVAPAATD